MPRFRLSALFLLLLATTACLDGGVFVPRIDDVSFAPELNVNIALSTRTASGLYYRDVTVGTGNLVRSAESGDSVSVRYEGFLRNAYKFDGNLTATEPLRFVTGDGTVIDGFDEGVRGMQVGGVRQIVLPPALAYGSRSQAGIPPTASWCSR